MKNVEIKARCNDTNRIRQILRELNAKFIGVDHQTDTYFKVPDGRLKLRQGNIETNLIFYSRTDSIDPKLSQVIMYKPADPEQLKQVLSSALGIKVVVEKIREIYFIDNVKFHIDQVQGLGNFVEIEAQDKEDNLSEQQLYDQCNYYLNLFQIPKSALISGSYSDMLLKKINS